MLFHSPRDQTTVLGLATIEPDVSGGAREGTLHHAGEAAMLLSNHRVAAVCGEDDDVDGARVVRHADRSRFSAVFTVVERYDS